MMLLIFLAYVVGLWAFIIAIAIPIPIPLTVIYQICSLLHLVTEHARVLRTSSAKVRDSHINNSHSRFCGRALPSSNLSGIAWGASWMTWWAEHLFVHLPTRLLIVQGSLIVHDWHHRFGTNRNGPNAIQKREEDLQKEFARGVYTYNHMWGDVDTLTNTATK